MEIHIRIHFHFSFFSECWQVGLLRWTVDPPSATFLTLVETSCYATGLQLNFPE